MTETTNTHNPLLPRIRLTAWEKAHGWSLNEAGELVPPQPTHGPRDPKFRMSAYDKTVQMRATKLLEGMLGKAVAVINEALEPTTEAILADPLVGDPMTRPDGSYRTIQYGGDTKVAMWLVDKLAPKAATVMPAEFKGKLNTMDEVVDAAQYVVEWVMSGEVSVEHGDKVLALLLRYAQMRSFQGVEQLRLLLEEFEKGHASVTTRPMRGDLMPQWGNLAKPANKEPAE